MDYGSTNFLDQLTIMLTFDSKINLKNIRYEKKSVFLETFDEMREKCKTALE